MRIDCVVMAVGASSRHRPRRAPDLRIDIAYASHEVAYGNMPFGEPERHISIGDPGQGRKLMTKPG